MQHESSRAQGGENSPEDFKMNESYDKVNLGSFLSIAEKSVSTEGIMHFPPKLVTKINILVTLEQEK